MSNVDLSSEFIGLITSSTAFQAASRVISTSNDMLDQLLMALR
jgi:flagellar hook protein FlgE